MIWSSETLKVLVVDDDAVDCRNIARLTKGEFTVFFANDEGSAKEVLEGSTVDCILLDYRIPGIDTLSMVQSLSTLKYPVIMLTGMGSEKIAVEAMKRGAEDYLIKSDLERDSLRRSIYNAVKKMQLHKDLLERQKELEDFAHVASHDLNAPLYKIRQACYLLHEFCEEELTEESARLIGILESSAVQMSQLISDLLEYSKIGRSKVPKGEVCCREIFGEVVDMLGAVIESANAIVTCSEDMPKVYGDRAALRQIFQNLIANAIKYCEKSPPLVHVHGIEKEDAWEISVSDNGIGIKEEYFTKIFGAFERLHSHSEYSGSGIGLATCKRIAEQHNGKIWVTSSLEEGSTFHFTLKKP